MTSLLGAKQRAEEFDALVEGRRAKSAPRPELVELVAVVGALRAQELPEPRAEFSAALRERLMAEAATSLRTNAALALPPRSHGARERRLALLASSFVLVGGSAGMAVAAQDALPGDALYPIKRGLENANTGLITSDAGRGREFLGQADSRLEEAYGLLDDPTGRTQIGTTLVDFTADATEGSELLLRSYADSNDEADVRELKTFTSDSIESLQELAKVAPAEIQDELAVAATTLMEIDELATAACPSCAPDLPSLQMPDLLMVVADANRAQRAVQSAEMNNNHPLLGAEPKPSERGDSKGTEGEKEPRTEKPAEEPAGSGQPGLPDREVDTDAPAGDGKGGKGVVEDVEEEAGETAGKLGDLNLGDVGDEELTEELDPILDILNP